MQAKEATLLAVLVDGFEKNECLDGFHWRELPCRSEADAVDRFRAFVDEAARWQGPPREVHDDGVRRRAVWTDLRIWQAGRGVRVDARAPWFSEWWHDEATWAGEPMAGIRDWLQEEESANG